ncbi:TIGR03862 family flavoprotein [Halopseudomonas xiamenensis]|uniref:TIGR03862 family flavoprotein n=1 Tax=Halopseudomonas xiamenensis TaxID=157792 RepID=UPI001624F487|nr:TIGR03862 family flavoprotein [Halopseudomonas xiamenensis]
MTPSSSCSRPLVAVIGGGPAGLMAAEQLAQAGLRVALYDAMPSVGRKFLLAGVGGMNITHSEPAEAFVGRYREAAPWVGEWLRQLDGPALRDWIHGLGIETFVGSSGRVFPTDMKAAPLLRAWLKRLRDSGVQFHTRHRWQGWDARQQLSFITPDGRPRQVNADAVVLALGGGSWARLGSDGSWTALLRERGIAVRELLPTNCGFTANWSQYLRQRFAGQPLKQVIARFTDLDGQPHERRGECILTEQGLEGSLIYALSAPLREQIQRQGHAVLQLDLAPDRSHAQLAALLAQPRKGQSLGNILRKRAGLDALKSALLHECLDKSQLTDAEQLAGGIKALSVRLLGTRPLDEAISSAGGVMAQALDQRLMLRQLPGVFCAGEMLDWEAPTGGYLLTACFASGLVAARGVVDWLGS